MNVLIAIKSKYTVLYLDHHIASLVAAAPISSTYLSRAEGESVFSVGGFSSARILGCVARNLTITLFQKYKHSFPALRYFPRALLRICGIEQRATDNSANERRAPNARS